MSEVLTSITTAVIQGQKDNIAKLIQEALDEELRAQDILYKGLMPGMDHVGDKFKAGDMFVPEVMRSARSMANSMAILKPLLIESGVEMIGKVLLGTVKGDLHDIGKNLVGMMCEGAGFEVKDLGIGVEPEAFVPVRDIMEELKERLKKIAPDTITLSGSGEGGSLTNTAGTATLTDTGGDAT